MGWGGVVGWKEVEGMWQLHRQRDGDGGQDEQDNQGQI